MGQTTEDRELAKARRETRLRLVIDLMRQDKWSPKQIPILAKEWGVSESSVRGISGEASRHVRGAFAKDKAQIRAEVLQKLEDISDEARDMRDFAPAVAALREIKDIVGLAAPVRHEMQAVIANMTTDDLYKQLAEVQRRAKAAIAEKDADQVAGLLEEGDEPQFAPMEIEADESNE
jgi:hypothetical protein